MYYKTLKNALGIEAVSAPAFIDTNRSMHPIVKSMLDKLCEQEMRRMDLGHGNVCRWHVANVVGIAKMTRSP